LAWKRGDLAAVGQRMIAAIIATLVLTLLVFGFLGFPITLAPIGLGIGIWVMVGAIAELADRAAIGRTSLKQSWARFKGLPRTAFSTAIAHFGVGVSVIGIVCATAFQTEIVTSMRPGETVDIAGYSISYEGEARVQGQNFVAEQGRFTIASPWGGERGLTSERRVYAVSGTPTTEAGIRTYGFSQMYVQFGERFGEDGRVVRLWHKPFVLLLWLGAAIMAGAGLLSLTDRPMRIGPPAGAKATPAAAGR